MLAQPVPGGWVGVLWSTENTLINTDVPLGSPRVAAFFSRIPSESSIILTRLRSELLSQPVTLSHILGWDPLEYGKLTDE